MEIVYDTGEVIELKVGVRHIPREYEIIKIVVSTSEIKKMGIAKFQKYKLKVLFPALGPKGKLMRSI